MERCTHANHTTRQGGQSPTGPDQFSLDVSLGRTFRLREMYIYLQAYESNATVAESLVAFVTFYRGRKKIFETPPYKTTEGLHPRSKAVSLRFSIPLDKLPPGEFDWQVTVLDPIGGKAAFWRAPVMLVQYGSLSGQSKITP